MDNGQKPAVPAFGRKVFFLYPPTFSVGVRIVEALKRLEYEVYTISDYRRAKAYMRIHHDALLFVNPDIQMSIPAWINFFRSIKEDVSFSSTIIGICYGYLMPVDLKALQECGYIEAGIFHVEKQLVGMVTSMAARMDSLGAKGQRQHVRASCASDRNAGFLWISQGRMFKAKLIDISTASAAILVSEDNLKFLNTKTKFVVSLQLSAKQMQIHVKSLVVKPKSPGVYAAIFLITEDTPEESITLIREYIFGTLEILMEQSIEGFAIDKTNYAIMPR